MSQTVELNQGEVKINFSSPTSGKVTFAELGLKNEDLVFESGLLRLVFDFEGIGEHNYYQVPTVEIAYAEDMNETHWQCDFNEETILDKTDHHGHSTVILLNRNKLSSLEHHHKNALTVHGEFPQPVHILAEESYINFFN
ncbi:MAG: hypothetical protein KDD41_02825 [Flavobacteriales bacterium]|nr:hypothetical protein [Flavobacteriales bacterium]